MRRQTLGRLSLSQSNSRAPSDDSEPRLKEKQTRHSMAAPGRRQSAVAARPSVGRQSTTSTKRAPQGRASVGVVSRGRNSVTGRQSITGNNRLSAFGSKASDPRPVGTKQYSQQSIRTLIAYLTTHNFDRPVSPKTLSAPTRSDFRAIITFLIRQIDANFEFGANFEEEVKTYLKLFGYPFSISKASLTAVGSPHTWPSLLAALVWMVELLTYQEEVSRLKGGERGNDLEVLVDGDEGEQVFFQFTAASYASFLEGSDNYTMLDQDLAETFQNKNKTVESEIYKLQARNEELKGAAGKLSNTEEEISELQTKRENFNSDLEKFRKMIEQLRAHKSAQDKKLEEKVAEHEQKQTLLVDLGAEKLELEDLLEKQEYTPLQVQEMNHQKQMLQANVSSLRTQKEDLQREIWGQEVKNSQTLLQLEKRVKEYNESAMSCELIPSTAKHAHGVNYEVKITPNAPDAASMVNVDLTKTVKPGLALLKKQTMNDIAAGQARLRELGDKLASTTDLRTEQARMVKLLEGRFSKSEGSLRQEKAAAEKELNETLAKIETKEISINQMRNSQVTILENSETSIHQLDAELLQQRQMQLTAREKLLREIHEMSEKVVEHKMRITQVIQDVLTRVKSHRENLELVVTKSPTKAQGPSLVKRR